MIHHSVQTNGNPLTSGQREEVVSQKSVPTSSNGLFFKSRLPSHVRKWVAFLNGEKYHRNCERIIPGRQVSLQFVVKIMLGKYSEGGRYERNGKVYQCRQSICQPTCSSKPPQPQWWLTICTTSCKFKTPAINSHWFYIFRTFLGTNNDYFCKRQRPVGLCCVERSVFTVTQEIDCHIFASQVVSGPINLHFSLRILKYVLEVLHVSEINVIFRRSTINSK